MTERKLTHTPRHWWFHFKEPVFIRWFSSYKLGPIVRLTPSSAVVRATRRTDGAHAIAKFIKQGENSTDLNVFFDEKELVLLAEPVTLPLLDYFISPTSGVGVLVLPFVESSVPHSPKLRQLAMRRLLESLAWCHERKLYHFDVKPQNILFSSDHKRLYLIDFGHSTSVDKPKPDDIGTPAYSPPEVLLGERDQWSAAVDVWGAGTVFAEWSLGQSLFSGRDFADVFDQMRDMFPRGKLRLPGKVNEALSPLERGFLLSMLRWDFEKRPTARQLLQHKYFKRDL